jgi:hypothetical protein
MTGARTLLCVVAATLAVCVHGASLAVVATVAGDAVAGFMDGPSTSARFNFPIDVAVLPDGVILVSDRKKGVIAARVSGGGAVPGRALLTSTHLPASAGRIREINPSEGIVLTRAGNMPTSSADGSCIGAASLPAPHGGVVRCEHRVDMLRAPIASFRGLTLLSGQGWRSARLGLPCSSQMRTTTSCEKYPSLVWLCLQVRTLVCPLAAAGLVLPRCA